MRSEVALRLFCEHRCDEVAAGVQVALAELGSARAAVVGPYYKMPEWTEVDATVTVPAHPADAVRLVAERLVHGEPGHDVASEGDASRVYDGRAEGVRFLIEGLVWASLDASAE